MPSNPLGALTNIEGNSGKILGWKTNWWKYGAIAAGGAALGIGALSYFRPTYNSGGGPIYTQQNGGDWMGSLLTGIMPIMMLTMMIPLMQKMMSNTSEKKDSA